MDPFSSGEELVIKTRKPYTISKQRERWTEEEHNRFLEALKLYGRAWQRIEEHIGTKTAVQIRSHAQKFFSKLEKEALAKGVPIGQAIDIDIPPPRPKRKPSNPYPRKKGITALGAQLRAKDGKSGAPASSSCCMQLMDLEKEPLPERANGDKKPTNPQDNLNESFSEVFTLLQDANCSSVSSVNKKSIQTSATLFKHGEFLQFVPSVKKTIKDNGTSNVSNMESSCTSNEKPVLWEKKEDSNCGLQTDEVQIIQDYPRPAPVHVVDGTLGICTEAPRDSRFQVPVFHPLREVQGQPNLFDGPAISLTAENHNNPSTSAQLSFPTFHSPYMPIGPDQNEYRSFLQASCTFSSLIVSTLLQNPAAHAAASFAATYWQYTGVERSAESPIPDQEGFQSRQLNSAPSMAAIAAATVAAATAWWAANGMLPVCAPLHTAFACAPPLATAVPATHGQFPVGRMHGEENTDKKPPAQEPQQDHEHSEAVKSQHSVSKSQTSSSSDSEEIGEAKPNTGTKTLEQDKVEAENELQDANKLKSRKQVDRSSCGSNTASSSEVETDAIKKHEKGKEDLKEVDPDHPTTDSSNRRNSRSTSSNSDSWKEVSEEGRLAFQALFSREVLPQSFSPPHGKKDEQNADGKTGDASALDLNCKMWGLCPEMQVADKKALTSENKAEEKGLLTIGLGQGKLKARRTGFKPYQRCSVEAKENRLMSTTSNQGEEKCSKRIRLEAKAST